MLPEKLQTLYMQMYSVKQGYLFGSIQMVTAFSIPAKSQQNYWLGFYPDGANKMI